MSCVKIYCLDKTVDSLPRPGSLVEVNDKIYDVFWMKNLGDEICITCNNGKVVMFLQCLILFGRRMYEILYLDKIYYLYASHVNLTILKS